MGILYMISRVISATGAFIWPSYASYKTLTRRPASEADLERWLMYWSVIGAMVGVEYFAEWTISWFPLYFEVKTLFLLYLALPQTQGSTYLYKAHLEPLLQTYETRIDEAIVQLRGSLYTFLQTSLRAVWQYISTHGPGTPPAATDQAQPGATPPTVQNPLAGPVQMAWGLWRTYGPGVIATAAAYMGPTANTPQTHQPLNLQQPPPPPPSTSTSTSSGYSLSDTASLIARRKQLEAELANLPAASPLPPAPSQVPMTPSSTYLPPPGEEGVNGSNGAGRYEQIERHEVEGITDTANQPRGWFGGWTGSGAPSPSAGDKSKTE